jgi:hypothetical protein
MATFLQRSNAWIESTFLYASTVFDPDSINVDNSNSNSGGGGAVDLTDKAHDNDNADEEEDVPQTEDTIPSGLVSSQKQYNYNTHHGGVNGGPQQRSINNSPIPPPSRRGKFVQVLHSGGSLDYYTNHTNNINDSNNSIAASIGEQSLPPHIVISDGEYCCIAFLSPETCVALLSVQPFSYSYCDPCSLPSKRSIIGISQYTVSTILQCCHNQRYDDDIMSPLAAAAAAAVQTTHNNNNNHNTTARRESSLLSIDKSRSRDSDMTVPLPIDLQIEMNSTIQRQIEADMHYQIISQLLFPDIPIIHYGTGRNSTDYAAAAAAISANERARRPPYQLIPPEIQQQLYTQIPNIQLYLCLYIQGTITFVGGENGGVIGDPMDVHCSVTLRRGLMHHLHLYGPSSSHHRNNNNNKYNILGKEDEGCYSHTMLIQRLEACHNYYYSLDHNNNNNNVQPQKMGGGGDGVQEESDDENTDDEQHVVVRKKHKTKKKKYGKGNTKRVVLGGDRERHGRNNNDRDNSSSTSTSNSSTMKWPWKSCCLTITHDVPIIPPQPTPPTNDGIGIGIRNNDRSKNSITDATAAAKGGGGREAEAINVQIIMENNNSNAPPSSPVFGIRGKSIATGYGNVTALFEDSTQDIFDILGLEEEVEDYDTVNPVITAPTTTTNTDAVPNNNIASVEKNNDKNDTNEIDSCDGDSGPTFVGIDDMIVDDDDEEEELAKNTADHQEEVNFGNNDGMTQDYLLTQPPDATSRRGNDNEDTLSLSSLLDDDEETTSPLSLRHPRRMPRRNLPRTSSPLPSRPLRNTTRNKKVVVDQQQALEKEDVPIERNHMQQQERPKRGRRKARETTQIPIHLRKAPPESLGLASTTALSLAPTEEVEVNDVNVDDDDEEEVYRQESQIPLSLMRNKKRDVDDEDEEDNDDDDNNQTRYESQIPLMTRMTKKSKLTNDEQAGGHVNQQEQYDVIESQLPLPQRPSRAIKPSSQKNRNDNDEYSEDSQDMMRVRRIKPIADEWMKVSKGKSVTSTATAVLAAAAAADDDDDSTTNDVFVESQIAGEGSDETSSPPSPMPSSVSKSPLRKARISTVAAAAAAAATTNQDIDQDNNNDHHRVRFAIDQTTTIVDTRDLPMRLLSKIDRILGLDSGPVSTTLKSEERKRTDSEAFEVTKFMDKVKRLCGE